MIRVFRCDGKHRTWGGPERLPGKGEQPETIWIDLEDATEEEERLVFQELFHLVLDGMVDEYVPVLDRLDESLDKVEEEVFANPDRSLLARLLSLKRSIILLRKTMIYEREVLARMSRGEFKLIEDRETVYY